MSTIYKNDLINKIGDIWLADTFQYTSLEDTPRVIQIDGANAKSINIKMDI